MKEIKMLHEFNGLILTGTYASREWDSHAVITIMQPGRSEWGGDGEAGFYHPAQSVSAPYATVDQIRRLAADLNAFADDIEAAIKEVNAPKPTAHVDDDMPF